MTGALRMVRRGIEYVPPEDVPTETVRAAERHPRPPGEARASSRGPRLTLLASASGLRQAMLLQEILGPPIALRPRGVDARHEDL